MTANDMRKLDNDVLTVKLGDLSEELFKLRFQHSIRAIDNTAKLSRLRKNIARVKTVITERVNEQ